MKKWKKYIMMLLLLVSLPALIMLPALAAEAPGKTNYMIGENYYVKLRDLGAALNFNVMWNESTNTVSIDAAKDYTSAY